MSDEEERMSTSGEESEQEDEEVEEDEEGEEMEGDEDEEPEPVPKGPKLPPGAVGFGMLIPAPGSVPLRKVERPAEKAQPAPTDVKETEFGRLELKKTPGPASNKPPPAASGEAEPEFAKVKLRKTNKDASQEITASSETTATHNNNDNPDVEDKRPTTDEAKEGGDKTDADSKEGGEAAPAEGKGKKGKKDNAEEGGERASGKGCCILM